MKIGEIKLQALSLIFPDATFEYAEGGLSELLFNLRSQSRYAPYLKASVGAINRALASVEQKGLSGTELYTETVRGNLGWHYVYLNKIEDFCALEGVSLIKDGKREATSFERSGIILAIESPKDSVIEIAYQRRLKRITHSTDDNEEITLPFGIEEAIAYFVMSDLLLGERPSEAVLARNIYEGMVNECRKTEGEGTFLNTVFSLGAL